MTACLLTDTMWKSRSWKQGRLLCFVLQRQQDNPNKEKQEWFLNTNLGHLKKAKHIKKKNQVRRKKNMLNKLWRAKASFVSPCPSHFQNQHQQNNNIYYTNMEYIRCVIITLSSWSSSTSTFFLSNIKTTWSCYYDNEDKEEEWLQSSTLWCWWDKKVHLLSFFSEFLTCRGESHHPPEFRAAKMIVKKN